MPEVDQRLGQEGDVRRLRRQALQDERRFVKKHTKFSNEEQPSYALGYLTPKEYQEMTAAQEAEQGPTRRRRR